MRDVDVLPKKDLIYNVPKKKVRVYPTSLRLDAETKDLLQWVVDELDTTLAGAVAISLETMKARIMRAKARQATAEARQEEERDAV